MLVKFKKLKLNLKFMADPSIKSLLACFTRLKLKNLTKLLNQFFSTLELLFRIVLRSFKFKSVQKGYQFYIIINIPIIICGKFSWLKNKVRLLAHLISMKLCQKSKIPN